MNENSIDEKNVNNGNKKIVFIVILVILLIAVALLVGIKYYFGSKNVIKMAINNNLTKLSNNISDYDSVGGSLSFKVNGKTSNDDIKLLLGIIENVDLSFDYGVDYKNKVMSYNIKSNYMNDKLLDADVYLKDNKGYIYSEGLYDKYAYVDIDEYSKIFETANKNDLKQVIEGVKEAIDVALKDNYFTEEKVTINDEKVLKTSLIIDDKNYLVIKKSFINSLLSNSGFLTSYTNISGLEVDKVKENLNNELIRESNFSDKVELDVYTKNLKFVKLDFIYNTSKIVVNKNNDVYSVDLYENNEVMFNLNFTVTKENDINKVKISLVDKTSNDVYNIDTTYSIKYNEKVNIPDVSNSISIEEISEEDMNGIMNKLTENKGFMELFQEINNSSSDYDM